MNSIRNRILTVQMALLFTLPSVSLWAQSLSVDKAASSIKVQGTSSLHDWEENAEDFDGSLKAEIKDGQLVKLESLVFTVVAESLKRGKKAMDKNTYKALKTDEHKIIRYQLDEVKSISASSVTSSKISTLGHLTIAGSRQSIAIDFKAVVKQNSVALTGTSHLNMTDYGIKPPTALLGTITTGDGIDIVFYIAFSKK